MGNRPLLLNKCGQFQSVSQRRRFTNILAVSNGVACLVAGRYNDQYVSAYSLLEIDYEADVSVLLPAPWGAQLVSGPGCLSDEVDDSGSRRGDRLRRHKAKYQLAHLKCGSDDACCELQSRIVFPLSRLALS